MNKRISDVINKVKGNTKVAENYFYMTFLSASTMLIGLLLYSYLIRTLGKESMGIYVVILSNMQLLGILINFGLDEPALKKISTNPDNKSVRSEAVSEVLSSKLLLFFGAFVILIVLSLFVPFVRENREIYFVVFSLHIAEILFPSWFFQGIQKMKVITYINLCAKILTIPLIFIFIHSPSDVLKYAMIISASYISGAIFAFFYLYKKGGVEVHFVGLLRIFYLIKEALPFFVTRSFNVVRKESIPIIIGRFYSVESVAVYDLANRIVMLVRMMITSINAALFPNIVQKYTAARVKLVMKYERYISFAIILCIVMFGYWAVLLLGGKNMAFAYPLSIVLSPTIYAILLVGCYVNFVFIPGNRYGFVAKTQFVALVSFILFAVVALLLTSNVIFIILAFTLSNFIEVLYCRFLTKKHNLL